MNDENESLQKIDSLSFDEQRKKIENYSIEMLNILAVNYYENLIRPEISDSLLSIILSERFKKLNNNFLWTNENKNKFLKINSNFLNIFQSSYNEAISVASELEKRIKNNDKFLKDYKIEIELSVYMHKKFYEDVKGSIGFVLSEPINKYKLSYFFKHSDYNKVIKGIPYYLDKSLNWNTEYFDDTFNEDYICYFIQELLDDYWSFYDIINISKITADVNVVHQYYIENII